MSSSSSLLTSLLLLLLALASVSAEFGETVYITPQRPAPSRKLLRSEEVEEMGCVDGSAPIFDCSARTWLCCLGTVYEYAAADGLNMKYYNYDQGAVCSMCCADKQTRCADNQCHETCEEDASDRGEEAALDANLW